MGAIAPISYLLPTPRSGNHQQAHPNHTSPTSRPPSTLSSLSSPRFSLLVPSSRSLPPLRTFAMPPKRSGLKPIAQPDKRQKTLSFTRLSPTAGDSDKENEPPASQTPSQRSSGAPSDTSCASRSSTSGMPLNVSRASLPSASRKRTLQSDDGSSDYANSESSEELEYEEQDMGEQELEEASLGEDDSIPVDDVNNDKHETQDIIRRCSITDAELSGETTVQQVKDFVKRIMPPLSNTKLDAFEKEIREHVCSSSPYLVPARVRDPKDWPYNRRLHGYNMETCLCWREGDPAKADSSLAQYGRREPGETYRLSSR
ncbi:hypothetical protein BKA58DRAFT_401343 [Alternaria rosae]|uniref:uncharacterized protein n=1 Tax=Alternaria rosae TaxID=1187941 RepID=UPI001E8D814F|nr:uncharacterized protein BKA58DRAFT_401343 [Alternaria rosae]KAH6873219.1 hypothetical protein BKA58DRAFT_401343 [Alternaria rosae]